MHGEELFYMTKIWKSQDQDEIKFDVMCFWGFFVTSMVSCDIFVWFLSWTFWKCDILKTAGHDKKKYAMCVVCMLDIQCTDWPKWRSSCLRNLLVHECQSLEACFVCALFNDSLKIFGLHIVWPKKPLSCRLHSHCHVTLPDRSAPKGSSNCHSIIVPPLNRSTPVRISAPRCF